MLRAIASGIAFLFSAFVTAILLVMAKPTCVIREGSDSLVCFGATYEDLRFVDYLITGTVGVIAMTVVWFVIGKLAAGQGNSSGSQFE